MNKEKKYTEPTTCIHCGSPIEWQGRYGDWNCCCFGYWFSHTSGSYCAKSAFGHEAAAVTAATLTPNMTKQDVLHWGIVAVAIVVIVTVVMVWGGR